MTGSWDAVTEPAGTVLFDVVDYVQADALPEELLFRSVETVPVDRRLL